MKRAYNLTIILLMITATHVWAQGVTLKKSYKFDYKTTTDQLIDLNNQFGKMHIETWDQDKITINVEVSVTQRIESKAQSTLDAINVEGKESKSAVSVKTSIGGRTNNNNNESFQIDYYVQMPKNNALKANQSFGALFLADLAGRATLDVSYGSIKTGKLLGNNTSVKISFSKGSVEHISSGSLEVKYSNLDVATVGNINLDQEFSEVSIEKSDVLTLDGRYGALKFGEIAEITGRISFSSFSLEKLNKSLALDVSYGGGVEINQISKDFTDIDLTGEFTKLNLHFSPNTNATFDVKTQFANLKYNDSNISFQNRVKEMNSAQYQGTLGKGGNPIKIDSRYGDVRFNN